MTQLAIDHLWQSTLFALLVAALTLAFRTNGAHIRFGLWLAASLKFLVPFPLIVAAGKLIPWSSAPTIFADAPWAETLEAFVAPSDALSGFVAPPEVMPPTDLTPPSVAFETMDAPMNVEPWLWSVWAFGACAVILWRTWQWSRLRAVVRASTPLPIATPIKVLSSPTALEPGLIGIFRPTLVLPEGIAEKLTPQQLGVVLAHELCHWRRRDNLTAAVHMLVEALFWFHPLVWWIERQLVAEREQACDERVLAEGISPRAYADSVVAVCRFYMRAPLVAAGMSGADLRVRVARIVRNATVRRLGRVKASALAILTAVTLLAPLAIGITVQAEAVAEIKAAPQIAEGLPSPQPMVPTVPGTIPAPLPVPQFLPAPPPKPVAPFTPKAKPQEETVVDADKWKIPPQPREFFPDAQSPIRPCLLSGAEPCAQEARPCLLGAEPCFQKPPGALTDDLRKKLPPQLRELPQLQPPKPCRLGAPGCEDKFGFRLLGTESETKQVAALERASKAKAAEEFQLAATDIKRAITGIPELAPLSANLLTDITSEGLRVQLVDSDQVDMFHPDSAVLKPKAKEVLLQVAKVIRTMPNRISISGHTDLSAAVDPSSRGSWELSAERALAARRALLEGGMKDSQIDKVVGRADKEPLDPLQPRSPRNRRVSIVVLAGRM